MKISQLFFILMLFNLVSQIAFGFSQSVMSDVDRTWNGAKIYIPANKDSNQKACEGSLSDAETSSCYDKSRLPKSKLIIIYVHGCDGMNSTALSLLKKASQMYIAPDSFMRAGRKSDCAVSSDKKAIIKQRDEEIDLAIKKIRSNPQLKPAKIVLMGFSEGAVAVALHPKGDEVGRIIVGWSCRSSDAWFRGVRSGPAVPVLAIQGEQDHYLQNRSNKGDCGDFILDNTMSKEVIVKNRDHQVLPEPETQSAVQNFLENFSSPPTTFYKSEQDSR